MNLYVSTITVSRNADIDPLIAACTCPLPVWWVDVDGRVGQQNLSCLELLEEDMRGDNRSQEIFWRRNGKEQAQRGNSFLVSYTELHSLRDTDAKDYLKCSTQNYSGEFHCSWIWDSSRVGKVAFIKRWLCSTGQSNFSCSVSESGTGSPAGGELLPLREERTIPVENYSKGFYLSEIVKPDKVRIGKVNATAIEWSYPSSGAPTLIPPHKKRTTFAVCVRAKDAFCNSQWSEWSHTVSVPQRRDGRISNTFI
uniref:Interleukin-12 beta central domain-containing protein n=1 Tax=Salarias fasciatus TaxID=181472 RepID=A0A672F9V3_SALFA